MNGLQQLKQQELNLDFADEQRPECGSEPVIAARPPESPTEEVPLLEIILERGNMTRALKRVVENKGAPGVDGMTVHSSDKRVLKLIRRFLESGVTIDGLVSPTEEGTPQGGPLSPLLSNIVLDELDTARRAEAA